MICILCTPHPPALFALESQIVYCRRSGFLGEENMDVETLSRIQFALTIMFHYIYPPLSIGLGLALVWIEGIYMATSNLHYKEAAKFWTKVFALTFAIGVATGIVMEFEFGTNWARYSRFVGDVFGSLLAAEGIFAFFLESGFLGLLLFGWDRIGPRLHYFATWMVALGAHFSAVWIVFANSWMQTPAGYHIVGEGIHQRAEIVDFWAMAFNPSALTRLSHTLIGSWLCGAFLLISVGAFYLLHKRHQTFAKISLKIGCNIAALSLILQLITGDQSGKIVAQYQPSKLAALEGVFETQKNAPLYVFGFPNVETKRIDYGIAIPGLLSFLSFGHFDAEVMGLDQVPRQDWPKVSWVFHSYHLMITMWGGMVLLVLMTLWRFRRGEIAESPWLLKALTLSVLLPQVANQAGWMACEMGRYPWIVFNMMRISEGLSPTITAEHVWYSLILFTCLYFMLFVLFIYLLNHKIQHGPTEVDPEPIYQKFKQALEDESRNKESL